MKQHLKHKLYLVNCILMSEKSQVVLKTAYEESLWEGDMLGGHAVFDGLLGNTSYTWYAHNTCTLCNSSADFYIPGDDACTKNRCENGTCKPRLGGYYCVCPKGRQLDTDQLKCIDGKAFIERVIWQICQFVTFKVPMRKKSEKSKYQLCGR